MRYRRSVYRKKRIKIVILTTAISLAAIILLFVVIGNLVGKKVEENVNDRNGAAEQPAPEHPSPRGVRAFCVALSDDGSSLASRLSAVASQGYTDVCFNMDTASGSLTYSSDVAARLGRQSNGSGLWSLPDAIGRFDDLGLYSIGVTRLPDFSTDDDLARSAAVGYHAALIAEALRAGVDDVLVCVGDIPAQRYDELIRLAEEVHRLCPNVGSVGVSISPSLAQGEENAELIHRIWQAFDYVAIDLTSATDEGVASVEYVDSTLGGMLYYLLRYELRVLLPYTDDSALIGQMTSAVASKGSVSYQIVSKNN